MTEQLRAGNISISTMSKVRQLKGLWLYPLSEIPQTGSKPRLIYDFLWSSLNAKVLQAAPIVTMQFRKALHRILDCIMEDYPQLFPTF